MKNFKILLYSLLFASVISSCDLTENPAIDGTSTEAMSGEWYLQLMEEDSSLVVDYTLATTSNTAANVPDKMWMNDGAHIFDFQSVINTNQSTLTFNAINAENLHFSETHSAPGGKPVVAIGATKTVSSATPERMTIENGSITKNSFTAPSKTKTDFLQCRITGLYKAFNYVADSYSINGTDTTVVWRLSGTSESADGPYILAGYKRTGFLEDEH
ncbi:MAG: hypothetical protein IPI50_14230 [Saprospiraceae bacterium]|nr:hypothetical protein [Saprospiraceae bacterium]